MSDADFFSRPEDPIRQGIDAPPTLRPIVPDALPGPLSLDFPLHPNFAWGVVWCIGLLLFTQVPGAIVSIIILFAGAALFPSVLPLDQMRDSASLLDNPIGQISVGAALFVAHALIIFFSLLLLRIVAGRDWARQIALRLPSFAHVCLVLVVAPAFMMLASGAYAAFDTKYLYVPSVGKDLPGAAAFLMVLAAGLLLLGIASFFLHVCGIRVRLPLAGQIALAAALAVAARLPAGWLYEYLRDHFSGGPVGMMQMPGMQQMEHLFARWPIAVAVLAIGVMPGLSEELWCRGFLGRGLVGKHGLFWGVLGTSFLFGLIHVDPRQGFMAMIVGVMIHYVYLTSRSLLAPMLLHFLNNSMAVVLPRIPALARLDQQEERVPWAVFAGAALLLAAVVWALYQSRARLVAQEGRLPWRPPYPGVACPPPETGTYVETPKPSALTLFLVAAGLAAFAGGLAAELMR